MQNLVLYRKYRPQRFAQIVGQEHVVRTLQGALMTGRVPHGVIFTGPRGTGKTTLARIFTKALNCTTLKSSAEKGGTATGGKAGHTFIEPCEICQSCTEITEGRSLDFVEIDAASNRGIDEIRELREGIAFSPMGGGYKVYLIDEFHMLTREAFNALLKTLEEPPAHAIFMLASTDISKVPETVLSRALRFDFRLLTAEEIRGELDRILVSEGVTVQKEAIAAIARSAAGSLRDAETLLEQLMILGKKHVTYEDAKDVLGFADFHAVLQLAELVLKGDTPGALAFFNGECAKGEDVEQMLGLLVEWVRKCLLLRVDAKLEVFAAADLSPDHKEILLAHAKLHTPQAFAKLEQLLMDKEIELKRTSFPALLVELAIVEAGDVVKAKVA